VSSLQDAKSDKLLAGTFHTPTRTLREMQGATILLEGEAPAEPPSSVFTARREARPPPLDLAPPRQEFLGLATRPGDPELEPQRNHEQAEQRRPDDDLRRDERLAAVMAREHERHHA
jgi:hypothetical protein